ncbi:MAG: phosphoglycerate kinase [Candidatus Thermoplasmatota archaeon]|nr:phosphoglycerate kinase [Candidatus Thermoplasmatota archaeon]
MARVLNLRDFNVESKTVLVRVDINSPLQPKSQEFLDDTRIRAIIPTLNLLTKSKVVILAHQSRPGKKDFTNTLGHSRELGRVLGRNVKWVEDIHGEKAMRAIEELNDGEILMLNNVRMDPEEVSVKGDFERMAETRIIQRLSSVVDVFVNDAFACAHRNSPSVVGFTHTLPCVAGELMKREIDALDLALENPARPCIAVVGGIKVEDSISIADNMLRKGIADQVWPTGGVANLLIEYSGIDIGQGNHDFLVNELGGAYHKTVETAKAMLNDFGEKIMLPTDLAANVEDNRVDLSINELPIDAPIFDIGINSTMSLSGVIKQAGTIILNGPAGVFELTDFALGTIEILNACAESSGYVVVGGGHTATLIMNRNLNSKMGHLSTGGGACLNYLAGRILPGIASLEYSAEKFKLKISQTITDN